MVEKKKSKTTQRRVSVSKELAHNVASQPLKKQKEQVFSKISNRLSKKVMRSIWRSVLLLVL